MEVRVRAQTGRAGRDIILGTLGLLGIVIIGNFGQVFFLLGITDEKCY